MAVGEAQTKARERARRRQPHRNERVLDAAAKVFAEHGYSEASVQDVADELGILKGSVYHYINAKEDLLFWLLEEVHRDVEEVRREVAVDGLNPLQRLRAYVKGQVLYNLANLERISIYYHDMERLRADRLKKILDQRHSHERFVNSLIREAQAQGLADPEADPRVLTNCLFGMVIWTYRWYRPRRGISADRVAELCADFALSGISGGASAPR